MNRGDAFLMVWWPIEEWMTVERRFPLTNSWELFLDPLYTQAKWVHSPVPRWVRWVAPRSLPCSLTSWNPMFGSSEVGYVRRPNRLTGSTDPPLEKI